MTDEAHRDAEAATNAIASGSDQANGQTRINLDSARPELETAKRLFQ